MQQNAARYHGNAGNISGIHRRWYPGVVSVVDGQHRYLGLVYAHELDPEFTDEWLKWVYGYMYNRTGLDRLTLAGG